jgi:hypothetical protein
MFNYNNIIRMTYVGLCLIHVSWLKTDHSVPSGRLVGRENNGPTYRPVGTAGGLYTKRPYGTKNNYP